MKYFCKSLYQFTSLMIATTIAMVLESRGIVQAQEASPGSSSLPSPEDVDAQEVIPIPPTTEPSFPDSQPLPSLDNLLESTPETAPPQTPEGDSDVTFIVERFQIEGNTAFSDAEIQEQVLDRYRGKPISFSDLLEIETEITQLYNENGYINSGALIPPQQTEQGVLIVQVIEGSIDSSQITVDGRLSEEYIRSRLQRGTKAPFNINELQEALQLLQLNPLVDRINAELAVGTSRNRWQLDIEVEQADAFDPSIFANNNRTPSVGSFQRGIVLRHNNFARGGEEISFAYRNTDGSNDYDFDFTVPYNSLDGTVSFGYRFIDSDIIEPPFDSLRINSQTDEYKLNIRQPVILEASANSTQELAVGLEFSRQANSTTIYNQQTQNSEPIPLSRGADDNGETNVIALRFFQDWTRRTRSDVLAGRSQFSLGLDAFDATVTEGQPDGNFFAWRGQLQWVRLLDTESNTTVLLRSDVQLTPNDLVALEQFSVGGADSVRGYRQDSLLGDNGIIFSGEFRFPFVRWNDNQNTIAIIPFTDFGTVWSDQEDADQEEDTVFSVGLGLQLNINERFNARLDWGIPLIEVDDSDRTLQEDGLYFSLEYSPF